LRGWVFIVGPTLVQDLAQFLALNERDVEIAFAQMESDGAILRGEFTAEEAIKPNYGIASLPLTEYEWCEEDCSRASTS